jgi:Cathepsin propeptide inhibitor domain (I29)
VQVHTSRSEYDDFVATHGRQHASEHERHARSILFQQHSAAIRQHNAQPGRTYSLALNRFADWTRAEYRALLGLRRSAETRTELAALHAGAAGTRSHRSVFKCATFWWSIVSVCLATGPARLWLARCFWTRQPPN